MILVRDDEAKANLKSEMGDSALVLTILESKGMEFDDVVLYNFFSGSDNLASYRCLHLLLDTEAGGLDVTKHAVRGFPALLRWFYIDYQTRRYAPSSRYNLLSSRREE